MLAARSMGEYHSIQHQGSWRHCRAGRHCHRSSTNNAGDLTEFELSECRFSCRSCVVSFVQHSLLGDVDIVECICVFSICVERCKTAFLHCPVSLICLPLSALSSRIRTKLSSRSTRYIAVNTVWSCVHSEFKFFEFFLKCFARGGVVCCVQHLLDVLCRDVETDLRLHIHMHLQLDSRNPFRVASQQLATFLRMTPIRLFQHDVNARGNLLHYCTVVTFFSTNVIVQLYWLLDKVFWCICYFTQPMSS